MKAGEVQSGIPPGEYAPPSGANLSLKPTKNNSSTPMTTGGTPWNKIKGVAKVRSHCGARGQAATAPSRLPITKDKAVVTANNVIVQGSESITRPMTVLGYLLNETPISKRATLVM